MEIEIGNGGWKWKLESGNGNRDWKRGMETESEIEVVDDRRKQKKC